MKTSYLCPKCNHEFCLRCLRVTWQEKDFGRKQPSMNCHECQTANYLESWRRKVREPVQPATHPDFFVDDDTEM